MNDSPPYLRAHQAYHAEPGDLPWNDMLSAHFHGPRSWVISTPEVFVVARRVDPDWPFLRLIDPADTSPTGTALHVYVAAGPLRTMVALIPPDVRHWLRSFTFQRRGFRIHRLNSIPLPPSASPPLRPHRRRSHG